MLDSYASEQGELHRKSQGADSLSSREDDLLKSSFSPLLISLYALVHRASSLRILFGSRSILRGLLRLSIRLEGGDFWSSTAREIMRRFHGVEIGAYSYGCFDPERFPPDVKIGRYVSIGPGVRIFLEDHPLDRVSTHPFFYNCRLGFVKKDNIGKSKLVIGNDVWVGANTVILSGCAMLGDGAVVGAASVVTRDVDDFCIVAGTPAKPLRYRFATILAEQIKQSRWWLRPVSELSDQINSMITPIDGDFESHPVIAVNSVVSMKTEIGCEENLA